MLRKSEFRIVVTRHSYLILTFFRNSELATYHHDAPYKSQTCVATYLLSGTVLRRYQDKGLSNEDIDMEEGPSSTQDEEDDDGDDVPQVEVTIVNEADLESSFKIYNDAIVDGF